jgi:hypothetical protein
MDILTITVIVFFLYLVISVWLLFLVYQLKVTLEGQDKNSKDHEKKDDDRFEEMFKILRE